ncbi:MAG: FGGY family carbohydrate kinase [Gammaproteobacteria bacterium]
MTADHILVIDQGTYSTRAIVFDGQGHVLASAHQPVSLDARSHTEIEQSPDEIVDSMHGVIDTVLADPAVAIARIRAAGLATQRSSVLAWDRVTGRPLSPVLSWQDRRTADAIDRLAKHEAEVEAITGLHLSPHYGGGKLQWLLRESAPVQKARAANTLLAGPLASYLVYRLLAERPACVDHANASRTLLWNLQTRDWDTHLLSLFGIPREILPVCRPIVDDYGQLAHHAVPLRVVNGDQTAALYAQGQPPSDTLIVNIGTGAFVLMPVDNPRDRPDGLLAGISHSEPDSARYYLEGTVNGAAAAVRQVASQYHAGDLRTQLPGWLDAIENPTVFINTIGGLGAPWWKSGPPPYFLDSGVDTAGAMVAVIESIVFLLQANIERLCRYNPAISRIRISGGLSNLDGLCQRLADLCGLVVQRPVQIEATARGIAWQVAGGPADWPPGGAGETFKPQTNKPLRSRYEGFIQILKETV